MAIWRPWLSTIASSRCLLRRQGCMSLLNAADFQFHYPLRSVSLFHVEADKPLAVAASSSETSLSWMQSSEVLVKGIYKSAKGNVRDIRLWETYAYRVLQMAPYMTATEIAVALYCFAKIRFRDHKVIEKLLPYVPHYLQEFSVWGLVMILNALRKLEVAKFDIMEIIIDQLCLNGRRLTTHDIALSANAVAYFGIYHSKFWRKLLENTLKFGSHFPPNHMAIMIQSMARMDIRDEKILRLFARITRPHCDSLPSEMLSGVFSSFIKLHYYSPSLLSALQKSITHRIEKAMELNARERTLGRKNGTFDLQALCTLAFSLICLPKLSESLVINILHLLSNNYNVLNEEKVKRLKTVEKLLRLGNPEFYQSLDKSIHSFLQRIQKSKLKFKHSHPSRWVREVMLCLRQMNIKFDRLNSDESAMDILIPDKMVVIKCTGPHSYYMKESKRTAYSQIHQKLLEYEGYYVSVLPYFEWNELRTIGEKKLFLWSFGRKTAEMMSADKNNKSLPWEDAELSGREDLDEDTTFSALSDLSELSDNESFIGEMAKTMMKNEETQISQNVVEGIEMPFDSEEEEKIFSFDTLQNLMLKKQK